jgi:hypothetical protein
MLAGFQIFPVVSVAVTFTGPVGVDVDSRFKDALAAELPVDRTELAIKVEVPVADPVNFIVYFYVTPTAGRASASAYSALGLLLQAGDQQANRTVLHAGDQLFDAFAAEQLAMVSIHTGAMQLNP